MSIANYNNERKNQLSIKRILLEQEYSFEDTMQDWEKFRDELPDKFYHLTDTRNLGNIKSNGLKPKYSQQHKFVNGVYLADSIYTAYNYHFLDGNKILPHIIIVDASKLKKDNLEPDDYEFFDIIRDDFPEIWNEFNGDTKAIWQSLEWWHSLIICGQVLYTDIIPSSAFKRVVSKEEAERIMNIR